MAEVLPPPAGGQLIITLFEKNIHFELKTVHCPPLAGAGCTNQKNDRMGVDKAEETYRMYKSAIPR